MKGSASNSAPPSGPEPISEEFERLLIRKLLLQPRPICHHADIHLPEKGTGNGTSFNDWASVRRKTEVFLPSTFLAFEVG